MVNMLLLLWGLGFLAKTDQVRLVDKTQEPFFDISSSSVFTGQLEGRVFLSCVIYNLHNKSVSWIRERDGYILTVDKETFISDNRFFAAHSSTGLSDTWSLGINQLEMSDQGKYQCQVSAADKLSRLTELVVIRPQVLIAGGPELYVKSGSRVQLRCIISQTVDPPPYVTWYFNGKMMIDFTGSQESLSHSVTESTSRLTLRGLTLSDGGNYTCQPASLQRANITLHVIEPVEEQRLSVTSADHTWLRCPQINLLCIFFIMANWP